MREGVLTGLCSPTHACLGRRAKDRAGQGERKCVDGFSRRKVRLQIPGNHWLSAAGFHMRRDGILMPCEASGMISTHCH